MKSYLAAIILNTVLIVSVALGSVMFTLHSIEFTTAHKLNRLNGKTIWFVTFYIGPFEYRLQADETEEEIYVERLETK